MFKSSLHCAISWCLLTCLMDQLLRLPRQPLLLLLLLLHSQTTLSRALPSDYNAQWREATVWRTVERSLQRASVSRWSRRCFAAHSA